MGDDNGTGDGLDKDVEKDSGMTDKPSNVIPMPAADELEQARREMEDVKKADQEQFEQSDGSGGGDGIGSRFIMDCLNANEMGDGELFKRIYRDKYLYNKSMDCWMRWAGHHWEVDVMDSVFGAVEGVVERYLEEMGRIRAKIRELKDGDHQESRLKFMNTLLSKRCNALRSTRRRGNCLTFAHKTENPVAIRGDEIDVKPWMLACPNGVIDLKSGKMRSGRPDDYLLKAANTEWMGIDEPCPLWEKTLMEIFEEDELLVEFLQRLFGSALVGASLENKIAVLTGQGRNGKSMIVETLCHVLGHMAGPIRSEMLLDQSRNLNSAGPTPDIMALRGLRLAFASETDEGCRVSPSRVKWLTGNDSLTGRNPHDKYEVSFKPTHTLFLLTNHKPHAPADDFAFWQRVMLIPFNLSFVDYEPQRDNERPADPDLAEKLKAEAPGILAWLVKGCRLWQEEGLNPPPKVKQATAEYQKDEDNIAAFIDNCCYEKEGITTGATPLYEEFEKWWKKYVSNFPMKQKKFGTLMRKKFDSHKVGGVYQYLNIGLIDQDHGDDYGPLN